MLEHLNLFLFGYYPYLALAVFLIGSLLRFDHEPYTWRSYSSQLLRKERMVLASNSFHIGVLFLFFGHLVGLLTPPAVYHAIGFSTSAKQILAIVSGGLFGLVCLFGFTLLLLRRLRDERVRSATSLADALVLGLLYVQLLLGLGSIFVSVQHLDGSRMVVLAEWAQRIVTFRGGAADLLADMHWIYRTHIALGVTLFLVLPFTRLVHIWSAPVWYLGRRGWQIVRAWAPR